MTTAPFFYQWETVDFPIKLEYSDGTGGVLDGYKDVKATLSQAGILLTKGIDELGIDADNDIVNMHLSQEETARFVVGSCELQVNIYYHDTERDVTTRGRIMVEKNLYKELMD